MTLGSYSNLEQTAMKKYILILTMVMGSFLYAEAQPKMPTPSEMATKNIDALDKKVKLNPTQRSIIYNYTLDLYKEQSEVSKRQQAGTGSEDDVTRYYKHQNETTQNIRNILKGEQQTQYDSFLEEQLRGGAKKKKKKHAKDDDDEVVTGISGLKLPANTPPANQ